METVELPQGLHVALVPGDHLHRSAAAYVVRVGARYEASSQAGLSHFLEHMLHRGTPSHPTAHALARAIEDLGANLDAATGVDHGSLVVTSPPESFLATLGILGQIVTSPVFSEIELERGIVHEELLEDRDERGRLVDPDGILRAELFGDHPLGQPIVGSLRTLRSFDNDALARHHRRHYTARSGVLALAGRFPPRDEVLTTVSTAFAGLPRGARVTAPRFRTAAEPRGLRVVRTHAPQVSLRVGVLGPGRRSPRVGAAELLLRVIDDGNATRLYERLCDGRGLCYEVSAGFEAYDEVGLFDVAAESQEDRIVEVLETVLGLFAELAKDGPQSDEISRAVARAEWQAKRSLDLPETLAEHAALGMLTREPPSPLARAERMRAVSLEQIRATAKSMFKPEHLTVVAVGALSRSTERDLRAVLAEAQGRARSPRKKRSR
ncbi:MAG: pitrilysin family protein [Polyangiaceae bacterium]